MRVFRTVLLASFLVTGHAALASPRDDAVYIVQRDLTPEWLDRVRSTIGRAFVFVYSKPLLRLNIEVADEDQFLELIPDEDIAPFVERYRVGLVEAYLSVYTPEQLAVVAEFLRADEGAKAEDLFSEVYLQKHIDALQHARANAQTLSSDDPQVKELEEFIAHQNASMASLEDSIDEIAQDTTVAFATLFTLMGYVMEINELEREFDHPVTVAALKTDGVFNYSNPVQRQTLIRELSSFESTSGIQFIQATTTGDD
jgi:hypothetical protein